jgi:DNA-binding NtrC family response regulator
MRHETTLDDGIPNSKQRTRSAEPPWTLTIAWCSDASRLGESLVIESRPRVMVFGRDPSDAPSSIVQLARPRPDGDLRAAPFEDPFLSRRHLELVPEAEGLRVRNVGRRALYVNGAETSEELLTIGDVVEIRGLLLFVCGRRASVAASRSSAASWPFGEADEHGIVGESPTIWSLRERIAFFGNRQAHVLVFGESGTGKELVAQAMHAASERSGRRIVARNAATLPSGLIDAELFGNVANYPNAGMPERAGIIGEAHDSTLFLDEIGELPLDSQTHFLRVLDDGGEYQRLGDPKKRRANLRVIAATNRPLAELKHDLLARFALRLEVTGLNERREDIALVARHLLRRTAARDPAIGARFFAGSEPRLASELVQRLARHTYTTHVRELDALLWRAIAGSPGDTVEMTDDLEGILFHPPRSQPARERTASEVREALARHAGVRERAWRELGLPSRHALHRLMKKYGLGNGTDNGTDETTP